MARPMPSVLTGTIFSIVPYKPPQHLYDRPNILRPVHVWLKEKNDEMHDLVLYDQSQLIDAFNSRSLQTNPHWLHTDQYERLVALATASKNKLVTVTLHGNNIITMMDELCRRLLLLAIGPRRQAPNDAPPLPRLPADLVG